MRVRLTAGMLVLAGLLVAVAVGLAANSIASRSFTPGVDALPSAGSLAPPRDESAHCCEGDQRAGHDGGEAEAEAEAQAQAEAHGHQPQHLDHRHLDHERRSRRERQRLRREGRRLGQLGRPRRRPRE